MRTHTKEELTEIIRLHGLWLSGDPAGRRADLRDSDLRDSDLSGSDLSGSDLRDSNLSGSDLSGSDLRDSNLSYSNLSYSNLRGSNLRDSNLSGSDLRDSNLSGSNLSGSDLRDSNLRDSNLRDSNLRGSNLRGTRLPALSMILLATWGDVSDELCVKLMRLDASAHDDPESFVRWAAGGPCPYRGRNFLRVANFNERRDLYTPGPAPTIYEAVTLLLAEKTKGWTPT